MKTLNLAAAFAIVMGMAGCKPEVVLPEATDENCTTENIMKLPTREAREEFSSLCLRRGKFQPSQPRPW